MRKSTSAFSLKLVGWVSLVLMGLSGAGRAVAADLRVVGGELVGASKVVVNGAVFDVSFQDGSCASIFGGPGCQSVAFAFSTLAAANLAGQALLDQVFIDGPAGNFDSAPNLVSGCTSASVCAAATPYGSDPPTNVRVVSAVNTSAGHPSSDVVQNFSVSETLDTTTISDAVYVVWTPVIQLQVVGGVLVGASNVLVDGAFYDVSFVDGSCASIFGGPGCQSVAFTFSTLAAANLAGQALLDQVFIDGPAGNFDSAPSLTSGCTDPFVCAAATPYASDPPTNVSVVSAVNVALGVGSDLLQSQSVSETLNGATLPEAVYAVWTPVVVPAVPALSPSGLGLAGLLLLLAGAYRIALRGRDSGTHRRPS